MKEYIYEKFLNKLDDRENIIILLNSLTTNDKNKFLEELMKK
jgi:vacuolar-type H+-ATPase subunit C/Vma6